ncbi:MAG TPA: carbon starvation CstA family protein [Burkholderiales bacterium]
MNGLYLAAATLVVFAFGYRFFAKLLALEIFRLEANYSTPAEAQADGRDYVPTHRQLLFGHHVAALTGAAAFAGPIVAAGWGWVPAFLWITAGSAVAAGTYGLGALWFAGRYPGNLADAAGRLVGSWARAVLRIAVPLVLLLIAAAAAGLGASILAAYPGAVLPLAAVAALGTLLGRYLHGRAESKLLPACAAAFALSLVALWLLGRLTFAVNGALVLSIGGHTVIEVDARIVWLAIQLVYAFHAAQLPVWKLMRPRAVLTTLQLVVLLAVFYVALGFERPALTAPEFHSASESSGSSLPWLFLVLGAGAFAGWQLFLVHSVTGRELRREPDARYAGYGGALVQGLAALSALLLAVTAFAGRSDWAAHYAAAPSATDFPQALVFYIDAYARHVDVLGIDAGTGRNLAATVLAGLALAVLEAAVRALRHTLPEFVPTWRQSPRTERRMLWLALGVVAGIALHDGSGLGGVRAWPALAMVSLWAAALGFAMMGVALRALERPAAPLAVFAGATAAVAAWTTVALAVWAWSESAWVLAAADLILLVAAGATAFEVVAAWRRTGPGEVPAGGRPASG